MKKHVTAKNYNICLEKKRIVYLHLKNKK